MLFPSCPLRNRVLNPVILSLRLPQISGRVESYAMQCWPLKDCNCDRCYGYSTFIQRFSYSAVIKMCRCIGLTLVQSFKCWQCAIVTTFMFKRCHVWTTPVPLFKRFWRRVHQIICSPNISPLKCVRSKKLGLQPTLRKYFTNLWKRIKLPLSEDWQKNS